MSNSIAKTYYKEDYHYQSAIHPNNIYIYGFVASFEPSTLFEFGCNVGRHLKEFRKIGIDVSGIDVSERAIKKGKSLYQLEKISAGDETALDLIDEVYDIVYVNSVLCHIENIDDIIKSLKRIGRKVIIFEAPDKEPSNVSSMSKFWYPRRYEDYGFTKVWSFYANSCDAEYSLYILDGSNL